MAKFGVVLAVLAGVAGCKKQDVDVPPHPDRLEEYGREQEKLAANKSAAELQLNRIGKNAKVEFITNDKFVVGTATPLPAGKCCGQPSNKCAVDAAAFPADPVWNALDFTLDAPSRFRYSYVGTATEFTATAVGDLDCDGVEATWTLKGTVTTDMPKVELTRPPKGQY